MQTKRYYLIDSIRGFALVSMVLYHAAYDVFCIFLNKSPSWYFGWQGQLWQQSIAWCFILVSGAAWCLGRHHLKRGIINLCAGFGLTLVLSIFLPSQLIVYGILTFIGCATILMIPADKLFKKFNPYCGIAISFLLFLITQNINNRYLGFAGLRIFVLPAAMYEIPGLAMLGFPTRDFFSTDYFSILPWFFLYMVGYFIFKAIKKPETLAMLETKIKPFHFIGKHSLIVYLLHQPMIYGILYLIYEL